MSIQRLRLLIQGFLQYHLGQLSSQQELQQRAVLGIHGALSWTVTVKGIDPNDDNNSRNPHEY